MAEPSSLNDLFHHRFTVDPSPEEDALLTASGFGGYRHQRDLLKARLALRLADGAAPANLPVDRERAAWRLSLLGEMVWECQSRGWWGGSATLPRLRGARDYLATVVRGDAAPFQGATGASFAWLLRLWPSRGTTGSAAVRA